VIVPTKMRRLQSMNKPFLLTLMLLVSVPVLANEDEEARIQSGGGGGSL
jgi:hypothetical protein